jgi:hypothetical protein
MRCHCNTQVAYSDCQTFTNATEEQKEKMKSCGKPCPKKVKKYINSELNDVNALPNTSASILLAI